MAIFVNFLQLSAIMAKGSKAEVLHIVCTPPPPFLLGMVAKQEGSDFFQGGGGVQFLDKK